jgi:iron(II)-dependent oxidoreductase
LGSVHIGPTIPPGAEVLVDGQSLGPAPVSGDGLSMGRHHLVVRAEGYYQHERAVAIRPGDIYQEVLDLVLKPMDAILPAEDMVRIEAGSFVMGCNPTVDDECIDSERPAREIQLDGYEIDRTEVTVLAYQACVADGLCDPPVRYAPGRYQACNWGHPERLDHPVNCITWADAEGYCTWRGTRLPTEAEWEHAARGRFGQRFPWGNEDATCELAVLSLRDCPREHTEPVGSLPDGQSPYGLLDVAGNVEEWTADWYGVDYYGVAPERTPTGPVEGHQGRRSSRGGGFDDTPDEARTSARDGESPDDPDEDVGFRCARSVGAQ